MQPHEIPEIRGITQAERVATSPGVVMQPNYAIPDSSKIQTALRPGLQTVEEGIRLVLK